MSDDTFYDLFPGLPRIDRDWQARKERLMAMTADQRVAAMRAGHLTYRELAHWSAARPTEVPTVSTGSGLGGGEFEWIAAFTLELAEANDALAQPSALDAQTRARGEQIRSKARAANRCAVTTR